MRSENTIPELVIPSLERLMKLEHSVVRAGFTLFPSRPVYNILTGKHYSPQRGRGLDFEESRRYVMGDDIRNIDWKVTARTGETHTKVFNEEREKPVLFVVDASASMLFGSERSTKFAIAAEAMALGAFYVLKRGDRVGGMVLGSDSLNYIKPQRDRRSLLHLFKSVVERGEEVIKSGYIQVDESHFETGINRVSKLIGSDYQVVIIGDMLQLSDAVRKDIVTINRHNNVMLIKVRDRLEEMLPEREMLLGDGEFQIEWNGVEGKNQKRLSKYIEENDNQLEKIQSYGIPIVSLNTSEDIVEQIKRIFLSKRGA